MPESLQEQNIRLQVLLIIADELGQPVEEIKLNDSFEDNLGMDSLDKVELVMHTEEDFAIEIADDEAEKILTVEQAIDFVKRKVAEKDEK